MYLDDILIFSTSLEEHLCSIKKILQKLSEANLKIQVDKCNFAEKSTKYLGHIVINGVIKPDPSKLSTIQKTALPTTQKEIKPFLATNTY